MSIVNMRIVIAPVAAKDGMVSGIWWQLQELFPGDITITHDTNGPFSTFGEAIADLAKKQIKGG